MPRRAPAPSSLQADLFGEPPPAVAALPPGLRYELDFLSADEEAALLARIATLPLAPMQYKSYTALRRVVSYGGRYDYDANRLNQGPPIPDWLGPLRVRAAQWLGVGPEDFTQALVAEYRPGTPLGWHRDVPDFEDVVGISLGRVAVMRFRPYPPIAPKKQDVIKLELAPRSIYLLRGAARWEWQHSVAPTPVLRHSITFRTRRRRTDR
jgi:alkylated DNA repair dioxygenase AlkB